MKTVSLRELPQSFQTPVQSELEAGEQIAWFAQPIPSWFAGKSISSVIFGTVWTSILVSGMTNVFGDQSKSRGKMDFTYLIVVIPFFLIGLLLITAPYWERRRLKRTLYVVTNLRALAIVLGSLGKRHVQDFRPNCLMLLERTEHRDGSGDLIFEIVTTGSGSSAHTEQRGFKYVADVKSVETLLRRTLLAGRVRNMPVEA